MKTIIELHLGTNLEDPLLFCKHHESGSIYWWFVSCHGKSDFLDARSFLRLIDHYLKTIKKVQDENIMTLVCELEMLADFTFGKHYFTECPPHVLFLFSQFWIFYVNVSLSFCDFASNQHCQNVIVRKWMWYV